jgi:hypothetical protein
MTIVFLPFKYIYMYMYSYLSMYHLSPMYICPLIHSLIIYFDFLSLTYTFTIILNKVVILGIIFYPHLLKTYFNNSPLIIMLDKDMANALYQREDLFIIQCLVI